MTYIYWSFGSMWHLSILAKSFGISKIRNLKVSLENITQVWGLINSIDKIREILQRIFNKIVLLGLYHFGRVDPHSKDM